jgi:hypothetical protein
MSHSDLCVGVMVAGTLVLAMPPFPPPQGGVEGGGREWAKGSCASQPAGGHRSLGPLARLETSHSQGLYPVRAVTFCGLSLAQALGSLGAFARPGPPLARGLCLLGALARSGLSVAQGFRSIRATARPEPSLTRGPHPHSCVNRKRCHIVILVCKSQLQACCGACEHRQGALGGIRPSVGGTVPL